jgi:hypothetical protein
MNNYREDVRHLKTETSWTFWKILPLFIVMLVVLSGIGFALNSAGLIGSTVVERVVFEQSFQYKTGMAQRGAILEANIAEIDMLLARNPENSTDLINQKSVLRSQLRAITINQ